MLKRALLVGASIGFAVPLLLLAHAQVTGQVFGYAEVALWPSSLLLMANERHEGEPVVWLNMALSVGANVVLYVAVAGAISAVLRLGNHVFRLVRRR
jgi:hypothetical protein